MKHTLRTTCFAALLAAAASAQTNFARDGKADASSHNNNKSKAARAVDGIVSDKSRWVSAKSPDPKWLTVRFDARRELRAAHVYSGYGTGSAIRDFELQTKRGSRFAVIPGTRVRGNKKQVVQLKFKQSVSTDAVRLVVHDKGHARVRELVLLDRDAPTGTGVEIKLPQAQRRFVVPDDAHLVAVNQVGFATDDPKRATCPISPDGSRFEVIAAKSGEVLHSGRVERGIADFSDFRPSDSDAEYALRISSADRKPALSTPFSIRGDLPSRAYWQSAVDFMIDCRSVIGTHPSAFGGCPWRDGTYYTFEVPSLVMLLRADPARIASMPRQIDWTADKARVLAPNFKFDAKNPGSKGVMEAVKRYFNELQPPDPAAPDVVKLIHWGLGYYLFRPETKDPSNDPLPRQVHSQTVEQFAFALWVWPELSKWLPQSFHDRCLAFVEKHWREVGLLGIDDWWKPSSWNSPVLKGDDWSIRKLHPYKGRHCPGHAILPNLLMHEVATRLGRDDAKRYIDAALRQAEFVITKIDWRDPRATKGQRSSENKLVPALVWLLQNYPEQAPKGLQAKIERWAEIAASRSDNMWDFRRYDLDHHWAIPKLNETGNLAAFPACAIAASWVVKKPETKARLRQLAQSHIDNLFGRNPRFAAAPNLPEQGFPMVEAGWPKAHHNNVCARLELCRGSLSASPGSEMYPFEPNGKFRHAEGWIVYGSAWNVTLAYQRFDRRQQAP